MGKLIFLLLLTCFGKLTLAEELAERDRGRLFIMSFGSTLDFYHLGKAQGEGLAPTSLATAQITSENITAALEADLSHLFEDYSLDINDDFDWGRFINEANVKIQNVGGRPVAVIVGKQTIPFGQDVLSMSLPLFWNNPVEQQRIIRGVMGVSVELSELTNFQSIVDQVDISVFESTRTWDFNLKGKPAYSIRFKKIIETDEHEHEITTSYARINNDHPTAPFLQPADDEERISLGFKTETPFVDDLTIWGEAIRFKNSPHFPGNRFLFSSGVVKQVSERVFLSGEFSTMNKLQKSYSGATWYRAYSEEGRQLTFGLEYRHNDYDNALLKDSNYIGITMRLQFYKAKGFRR